MENILVHFLAASPDEVLSFEFQDDLAEIPTPPEAIWFYFGAVESGPVHEHDLIGFWMDFEGKMDLGDARPRHDKIAILSHFHYHPRTTAFRNVITDLETVLFCFTESGSLLAQRYKTLVVHGMEHLLGLGRLLMWNKVEDRLDMRYSAEHHDLVGATTK